MTTYYSNPVMSSTADDPDKEFTINTEDCPISVENGVSSFKLNKMIVNYPYRYHVKGETYIVILDSSAPHIINVYRELDEK